MNYRRLYLDLIEKAERENGRPKNRNDRKSGFEIHHITPRSWGGSDHSDNLVYFTYRQHYTAHHALARLCGAGMWVAFWRMCNNSKQYKISSRQYGVVRAMVSGLARMQMTGTKPSEETRKKQSLARKGKKFSNEHKTNLAKTMIGNKRSLGAIREKVICEHCGKSMAKNIYSGYHGDKCPVLTGEKRKTNCKEMTCPHCNKTGRSAGNMKRYHFDNCKHKPVEAA